MSVAHQLPQATSQSGHLCQAPVTAEFKHIPLTDIEQDWKMLTQSDEDVLHFLSDPAYHRLDHHLRTFGQFFPIIVRPYGKGGTRFAITDGPPVAGERRSLGRYQVGRHVFSMFST
jgi:hypothetical protein